ncbi:hypothetical protein V6N11_043774 [Hibiscus sabdariffa]|uniref:DYW domain-containing protein n=1 Tax=Hibiscus sabdariffa TaxID=183260 RepID=A0ABR2RDC7_9ROSI
MCYSANDMLHPQMEKEGYKPDTSCVLRDVDEKIKIEYSEWLAIAFALISTPAESPILYWGSLLVDWPDSIASLISPPTLVADGKELNIQG